MGNKIALLVVSLATLPYAHSAGEPKEKAPDEKSIGIVDTFKMRKELSIKAGIAGLLWQAMPKELKTRELEQEKKLCDEIVASLDIYVRQVVMNKVIAEIKKSKLPEADLFLEKASAFIQAFKDRIEKRKQEFYQYIETEAKRQIEALPDPDLAKEEAELEQKEIKFYFYDMVEVWNAKNKIIFYEGELARKRKEYKTEFEKFKKKYNNSDPQDFEDTDAGRELAIDIGHVIQGVKDSERDYHGLLHIREIRDAEMKSERQAFEAKKQARGFGGAPKSLISENSEYKKQWEQVCCKNPLVLHWLTQNQPLFHLCDLKECAKEAGLEREAEEILKLRDKVVVKVFTSLMKEIQTLAESLKQAEQDE